MRSITGYWLNSTLSLMLVLGCVSCAQSVEKMDRPIFHSLEFGNDGLGAVSGVSIEYGGLKKPRGLTHREYAPNHAVGFSETLTMTVPETVIASWMSADHKQHVEHLPVRSLIQDTERFHGFRFFFVDDAVDVYVVYRKPGWPKILDVDIVKMYSSK